jgi:dephospho-CoA kinase
MLRVGLTGGLASGKSTVAACLRSLGAQLIEADELGRALMEPGQPVFAPIVEHFGPQVVAADGRLDRAALARMAFQEGRLQELNALIHPGVLQAQHKWMDALFAQNPAAIAVVESALIFEVERDARLRGETSGLLADWRSRIDKIIVVTAPEEVRIARYIARVADAGLGREAAEADARRRLIHQIPDAEKAARADYVIENTGDLDDLRRKTSAIWGQLQSENNDFAPPRSLE